MADRDLPQVPPSQGSPPFFSFDVQGLPPRNPRRGGCSGCAARFLWIFPSPVSPSSRTSPNWTGEESGICFSLRDCDLSFGPLRCFFSGEMRSRVFSSVDVHFYLWRQLHNEEVFESFLR